MLNFDLFPFSFCWALPSEILVSPEDSRTGGLLKADPLSRAGWLWRRWRAPLLVAHDLRLHGGGGDQASVCLPLRWRFTGRWEIGPSPWESGILTRPPHSSLGMVPLLLRAPAWPLGAVAAARHPRELLEFPRCFQAFVKAAFESTAKTKVKIRYRQLGWLHPRGRREAWLLWRGRFLCLRPSAGWRARSWTLSGISGASPAFPLSFPDLSESWKFKGKDWVCKVAIIWLGWMGSPERIQAGAGQWGVSSSRMRWTVTGRAKQLGLRWRGEKKNSWGEELEAEKGAGDGRAEKLGRGHYTDSDSRGRERGAGMKSTVRGATDSGWEKQPGERGEELGPQWEMQGLRLGG